jgi:hypothetical protein
MAIGALRTGGNNTGIVEVQRGHRHSHETGIATV